MDGRNPAPPKTVDTNKQRFRMVSQWAGFGPSTVWSGPASQSLKSEKKAARRKKSRRSGHGDPHRAHLDGAEVHDQALQGGRGEGDMPCEGGP